MLDAITKTVAEYDKDCSDLLTQFKITEDGQCIIGDSQKSYEPTAWATHQICKIAGCTPKFFKILSDIREAKVVNYVIGDKDYLFRMHGSFVRAILSAHYKYEYSNAWVIENLAKRLNFAKVLSANNPKIKMGFFDDDMMILEVTSGNKEAQLLILNGETGRVALTFLIKIPYENFYLTSTVHIKIHTSTSIEFTEEALTSAVTTVVSNINVLKPDLDTTIFKIRRIDLRMFPYPSEIKKILLGEDTIEKLKSDNEIVPIAFKDIINNATKVEDMKWKIILSCDFYNVASALNKYIKSGWLAKWPIRVNWLR